MASTDSNDRSKPQLASYFVAEPHRLQLHDGSRVGVIGGGPAGSLFAYFLLDFAETVGLDLSVEIFEPRNFDRLGPSGCNHCGGIVSESLIQLLASEGINLPAGVIQRGIDSYALHMDIGDVRIATPGQERRIAGVYRGNGPRHAEDVDVASFDRYLLDLARSRGAVHVRKLVNDVLTTGDHIRLNCANADWEEFDLVAVASGVNSRLFELFDEDATEYRAPEVIKTFICEFDLGEGTAALQQASSVHVFLLDLPGLEFAAIIPKGRFATLCLLGEGVGPDLVDGFLRAPEVAAQFPDARVPQAACHCFPRICVQSAVQPYADRMVWIGDCGTARLYKDGIGSAYRTAKAAARTVAFAGIASADFERHFWPACQAIKRDNLLARPIFFATSIIQRVRPLRRGVLRMVATEQSGARAPRLSSVLWDTFTGSAPYREVFSRMLHPAFMARFVWNLIVSNLPFGKGRRLSGGAYEN